MLDTIEPLILGDVDAENELKTESADGAIHEMLFGDRGTLIAYGHIGDVEFVQRAYHLLRSRQLTLPRTMHVVRRYALVMFDDDARTIIAWDDERELLHPKVTGTTLGSVPVTVAEIDL